MNDGEWIEVMSNAEVALVSMVPEAGKVVMPSKTYSAMSAGQSILAVTPGDSDLAELVRQHGRGWTVEPGDAEGFADTVRSILEDPAELAKKRTNALQAARDFYDVEKIAEKWAKLFEELSVSAATLPHREDAPPCRK